MIYRRTFAEARDSVPEARHFTAATLDGMPRETVDSVSLMVSELATNAVQHATSTFEVLIDRESDRVTVDVSDNGTGAAAPRVHALTDPSGRGLHIVGALADSWGIRPASPEWQKAVWFTVLVPTAAAAD